MIKKNKYNLYQQVAALKRAYDFGNVVIKNNNQLVWEGALKSSPLGDVYQVRIVYGVNGTPEIFVTNPLPLKLAEGKSKLEHVYDQKRQRLCLYYPAHREWDDTKSIAATIVPWTIDWLYHYENWVITGNWEGGGVHLSKK